MFVKTDTTRFFGLSYFQRKERNHDFPIKKSSTMSNMLNETLIFIYLVDIEK